MEAAPQGGLPHKAVPEAQPVAGPSGSGSSGLAPMDTSSAAAQDPQAFLDDKVRSRLSCLAHKGLHL